MKYLGWIILLFGLCNARVVKEYGPEDINICDHIIVLSEGQDSAFSFTNRHILNSWDGSSDFKCTFGVESQDKIAMVFQYFNLRKKSSDEQCIDYIQLRNANNETNLKVCGISNALTNENEESKTFITNPFLVPERYSLNYFVEIFLGKDILQSKDKFNFTISFTAWKSCVKDYLPLDYVPCGKTDMCIWNELYYYDGEIVNCPFQDCLDEPRLCGTGSPESNTTIFYLLIAGTVLFVLGYYLLSSLFPLLKTDHTCNCISPQTPPRENGFVFYRHRTNFNSSTLN
ncbi:Hypothetical predicted protein [Cloeon dipterum]|uniref:CUB domain-containing protein n=1 Tax=Cloeon dipterum TaxID=197152 RepID=A0A8S1DAB4_9INSE|nr:Hypothetical predicted protein [Cloeon dipterum]